jgi:hypothetical protein
VIVRVNFMLEPQAAADGARTRKRGELALALLAAEIVG